MKAKCCYRLIPNGEVIHSLFDTDTQIVDFMPPNFLDTQNLEPGIYNPAMYAGNETAFDAMCEAILLSNDDYAFVLEYSTIGYFITQWDGFWRYLETPLDWHDKGRDLIMPCPINFTFIGYRRTTLRQYRACSGIFRLVLDKRNDLIPTNDGYLTPEFDITTLSKIDFKYAGYKDMVATGGYAVVYVDGKPVILDLVDKHRLVPRK